MPTPIPPASVYNRVPISRRVLADLDTPLSVYRKLAAGPFSYLLESVQGGEKWGRYSIIGLPARRILSVRGTAVSILQDGLTIERLDTPDPLEFVRQYHARIQAQPLAVSRFSGGLVGYFGYDSVRYVEPRLALSTPPDTLNTPDILLMLSDEFVVFDNLRGEMELVVCVDPAQVGARAIAETRLDELVGQLSQPLKTTPSTGTCPVPKEKDFASAVGQEAFKAAVVQIKH